MPFPYWVWQAPSVLSVKFSHVAEASGMYLLETESGLLYFSAPAPPTELSAEVAESRLSLSPSFKSWGWHTVRLMTKFTILRAIVSDFQMTQAMIVSSAKLRLWFKYICLAIMKVCLACLCIGLPLALSSPCTICMYQETLEKQIYTPLEAMLCCRVVWKKWACILILV